MIALLGKDSIISIFILSHDTLHFFHFSLLSILIHYSLIQSLLLWNCISIHRFLILDKNTLLNFCHNPHFKLLFKQLLSLPIDLLVISLYIFSLIFNSWVKFEEILFPMEDFWLILEGWLSIKLRSTSKSTCICKATILLVFSLLTWWLLLTLVVLFEVVVSWHEGATYPRFIDVICKLSKPSSFHI